MAKNPSQYGLDSITPDPQMAYDTVKISYPVDLRLVADCVGASPEELQDLNPSLLRMSTPRLTSSTKDHFDLHLPIGTSAKYQTAIALIPPDMRLWWRYYTVTPGDTLMSVARKYRTTTRTIADANQLEASADLEAGAKLIIPVSPGKHGSSEVEAYAKRTTVYRIRKNDTVQTVSDNLGISPLTIRRWNGLKSNSLSGRRVLYVHLPISPTAATSERLAYKSRSNSKLRTPKQPSRGGPVRHTVKRGETLYSIANNYKTSVNAIKQTNTNVATLRPGMVLIIPAR
jgi:membrane-bound lytic murein transglycosylase D